MLPFLIAAAASIIAARKKAELEHQALYMDELKQNASHFGGNTQMADVLERQRAINSQGANYGPALGLVGQLGGDKKADTNPNDVFGPTSYAHDAGGVQYNAPSTLGDDPAYNYGTDYAGADVSALNPDDEDDVLRR